MAKPDIKRVIEFHRLLNDFAAIERVIHVKRHGKHTLESDTEHSYNLAMMAWFLAEHFPHLDKNRVILLSLVHDIVEVHAGDTFAFADQELLDSKPAREAAAQKQLAAEWPDFPDMHAAIHEYELRQTPEACFVYALDKLMPMLAIYLNEGHTWHENGLTLERLNKEKQPKIACSPEVKQYWNELYDLLLKSPELLPKA
jgi:putative hydrolases of HD superfamily